MNKFFKKFWPLFFIFSLWFLFSAPFFLHGKIPFPGDYQVTFFSPWSQYSQFAMPVKNSAMPDVIDQLYPWRHLVITDWTSNVIPLWNPYNFAGTPLLANYQSSVFSPMNMLFFIFSFNTAWALLILFQPLIAGIGMYFFARKISVSQIGASLASISFMFCGFIVCWMGYGTLSYAVSILPYILLGLEGYILDKKFRYVLLTSSALAFSFVSGHFQMSLYVLLAGILYFLFRFLPTKNIKNILFGFSAILAGVLLASVQIFPSIEFYTQSLRSTIFSRPEVIPWQYLLTFISPDFFGNPVTRNDWFGHYAEWNSYIGVTPFLFGLFSLSVIKKNKYVSFFWGLGIIALLMATPTILGDIILQLKVPVLATSAAGRIMVLCSFSLAILAGFGIDEWMHSSSKKKIYSMFLPLVCLGLGWGVIFSKFGLSIEHVQIAKQNFILPSIFILSFFFISLISFFVKNKKIIYIVGFLFLLISSFDSYRFASKWQSFTDEKYIFPSVGVTQFFQSIKDKRSLGNYGGQVSLYYQIPSLDGYDALYPSKIGEFASYVADGSFHPASRSVVDFPKNGRYTKEALDLLGVQYSINKISDTGKVWTYPFWLYPSELTEVYKDDSYLVLKNAKAYPRTFVVGNYVVKTSKQDILSTLFNSSLNRAETLVLEENPGIAKNSNLSGNARITSYIADKVTIATQSNQQGLLFLSDTYFPGWKAYVDGKETKIYEADYAFRSIVLPKGLHTVVFQYQPISFTLGIIATIGSILFLGIMYFLFPL